jgi:hypothetical protein
LTLVARAVTDLGLVAEYWPGLNEQKDPSVFAPRPPSLLTPEQRAVLDYDARIERQERDGLMPGEHPDAARADVLDLLASLAYDAWDLADTVGQAVGQPRLPRPAPFADPAPHLHITIHYLPAAAEADDLVGPWVASQARRMLGELTRALCLTFSGQTLAAICPWCQGRTESAPAGGQRTWRVRDLLGTLACSHGHIDKALCNKCPQQIAIVCESHTCEPPSDKIGTWWRGMPAWPIYEWDWLAKQLHAADDRGKMSA